MIAAEIRLHLSLPIFVVVCYNIIRTCSSNVNREKTMTWTRRDFLKTAAVGGAAAAGALASSQALADFTPTKSNKKLKILILGGTAFLGPAVVHQARSRGHEITLFNRGKTNADMFPDIEKLKGDRFGELQALETGQWDVVIDNSGYIPSTVKDSAELLASRAKLYIFISSISVYADFSQPGNNEKSPVGVITDEEIAAAQSMKDITGLNYGPLKALCEQEAEKAFPLRCCNIRPGLIVGPMDRSDRFTYWPVRIANGGTVLAPNDPNDPVQFIDARDLAAFMVDAADQGLHGIYNVTGPTEPTSIGALLEACREATGSNAELVWAPTSFLAEQEVAPWMQLTVWVPPDDPEFGGMGQVDISKAVAAGLTFRPLHDTVTDTLAWWNELPEARRGQPRAGLASDKEREVLTALAASNVQPAA